MREILLRNTLCNAKQAHVLQTIGATIDAQQPSVKLRDFQSISRLFLYHKMSLSKALQGKKMTTNISRLSARVKIINNHGL